MTRPNRQSKPSSLAHLVSHLVTPVLKSHSVKGGGLLYDWKRIVGKPLADLSSPEKITYPKSSLGGGTLYVTVSSSLSLYVQHNQTQIIDKINTYFGYKAIGILKIKQGHFPIKIKQTPPPLSSQVKEKISTYVSEIKDEDISKALKNLGEAIALDTLPKS